MSNQNNPQSNETVLNLDGKKSSLFSLCNLANDKWKKKYEKKYKEFRESRLAIEDAPSICSGYGRSDSYLIMPKKLSVSPDVEPYILSKAEYAEKNINDIRLKIERGDQLVSCVVGGISFYPIRKCLSRKFLRSVYFQYQWFYVAIPLDNEGKLITSQIFAWLGDNWAPYSDETLLSWMASKIGSSVVFTKKREMKLDPQPEAPDEPNSYYSSIQEKVSRVKKEYPKMDEANYLNKDINDISFQFEESIQVGKLIFFHWRIPKYKVCIFTQYKEIQYGFPLDKSGFPITNELYYMSENTFLKYIGNKEAVVRGICQEIHPSVKFSILKKLKFGKSSPVPDEPNSYAAVFHQKICFLKSQNNFNVLPKEEYLKKELNQISIQVDVGVPCKVGNLILYPRPKLTSVLINGSNLSPKFDGLYFAFQIRGPERFLVTDKCFINTDQGWKVYAKERKDFHEIILKLMKHAIDSSFPSPPIENIIASDPGAPDSEGEMLCDSMIRLYREEYSSNVRLYEIEGDIIRPLEVLVEELLSNQKIPQDRKYQSLKKFFGGYLPNTDWNALHSILAKYEVPQEICDEAKKTEIETAKAEAEFDQSPHE